MRILYVIDSMTKDGAESQFRKTLTHLAPDRYAAHVVLTRAAGEYFEKLAAIPCVTDITALTGKDTPWQLMEKTFTLGRLVKAVAPDIVHSWLWYSNFLCGLSRKFGMWTDIPFIVSQRGDYHARYRNFRLWWTEKIIYNTADCLLTNAEQIQQQLQKQYPQKYIMSIPNILALPNHKWSQQQKDSSAEKRIVCVGRFAPEKGHRYLIEALSLLNPKHVRWHCVFLGEGTLASELHALTATHNLSEKILFPGFCENVFPELLQSDVFVLPSLHEGSPNALIEAMGVGMPCIASDVGGIKDLITHEKNGILVPAQNPKALAHALHRTLLDPPFAAALGKNAYTTIQQKFNTETSIHSLEKIYHGFLKNK